MNELDREKGGSYLGGFADGCRTTSMFLPQCFSEVEVGAVRVCIQHFLTTDGKCTRSENVSAAYNLRQ